MGHNHHATMSSTKHNIRSNWVRRYILSWHASFLTEADLSSTTSSNTNDNSSGHTQSAHAHFPQLHGLRHLKQDLPVSPQHPNTNTPRLPSPSRTHLRYLPFPLPPKTANPSPMPLLRPPHAATERTFPTQHRQRWNLVCLSACIHWQLCLWTPIVEGTFVCPARHSWVLPPSLKGSTPRARARARSRSRSKSRDKAKARARSDFLQDMCLPPSPLTPSSQTVGSGIDHRSRFKIV